jgi:hypothetical protein
MNLKGFERKQSWINKILSQHFPEGTEEIHEDFSQDSECPDRNWNQAPPQYKLGPCRCTNLFDPSINSLSTSLHM